jgi:hypothetical protein
MVIGEKGSLCLNSILPQTADQCKTAIAGTQGEELLRRDCVLVYGHARAVLRLLHGFGAWKATLHAT